MEQQATGATLHFKNTPMKKSQLFLFKGSPHMPTGKIINDLNDLEKEWVPLQKFFKTLLNGDGLTCEELNQLNKNISDSTGFCSWKKWTQKL